MNGIFTGRRDFLKQAGWMGSIAMMAGLPESAMAWSGGPVESVTLPAQAAELVITAQRNAKMVTLKD